MSSDRNIARSIALALLVVSACADVRRGEYWHEPEGSSGVAEGDGADDGVNDGPGPAGSTSAGDDGSDGAQTEGGTAGTTGGDEGPSFAEDVEPLLDAGCERCHAADGQASNTAFILVGQLDEDYDMTLQFVDLGDPESSRLLSKGSGSGHTGGVIFDDRSSEYETILEWIEYGARP